MLAKLIVTGRDRQQALQRARRALAEFEVGGMPTVLAFHRTVVEDPAFAPPDPDVPFSVHTRWIETEFDNTIEPFDTAAGETEPPLPMQRVVLEVNGRRMEVALPAAFGTGAAPASGSKSAPRRSRSRSGGTTVSGDTVTSPMQGTVVKIVAGEGDTVSAGDTILVLEAMKMEQAIEAHKDGVVMGLQAEVGQTVTSGAVLCELKDAE